MGVTLAVSQWVLGQCSLAFVVSNYCLQHAQWNWVNLHVHVTSCIYKSERDHITLKYLSHTPDFDTSQHTFSADQVSRVWTPPIPSTVSTHPSLRNQTWVTVVEHLWTLCVSVALQRSTLGGNRRTTVNWTEDIFKRSKLVPHLDVWMFFKVNLFKLSYSTFSQPIGMLPALLSSI